MMAHRLTRRLSEARTKSEFGWLHPDGQAQVAIAYRERRPAVVRGVTLFSALQGWRPEPDTVSSRLNEAVIQPVLAEFGLPLAPDARIIVNPAGMPGVGGPSHHAGLTGRKNDIDCYGGYSRHGGAALSGKDPLRIDRCAAYAARHAAKTVVASGLARECEVQLSYAIGQAEPISVELDTFGTGSLPDERITAALRTLIDFDANAIADRFGLSGLPERHGGRFFSRLATFGHFGRADLELPWEAADEAARLAAAAD
jgi:S-adenosylmethionine synthetase